MPDSKSQSLIDPSSEALASWENSGWKLIEFTLDLNKIINLCPARINFAGIFGNNWDVSLSFEHYLLPLLV